MFGSVKDFEPVVERLIKVSLKLCQYPQIFPNQLRDRRAKSHHTTGKSTRRHSFPKPKSSSQQPKRLNRRATRKKHPSFTCMCCHESSIIIGANRSSDEAPQSTASLDFPHPDQKSSGMPGRKAKRPHAKVWLCVSVRLKKSPSLTSTALQMKAKKSRSTTICLLVRPRTSPSL